MMITTVLILLPLMATGCPLLSSCNCGLGPGRDVCGGGAAAVHTCTPLVVRPVDVPLPPAPKPPVPAPPPLPLPLPGLAALKPVPGPCTCHNTVVKPAKVPPPPCGACGGYQGRIDITNNQLLTASQKQQILFGGLAPTPVIPAVPVLVDEANPATAVNPANYVPADPVSLHVAYKLAQERCDHAEDKLAFGFRSLPRDVPMFVTKPGVDIPEEHLFSLNGQIVELKAKKCAKAAKSLDEEAREQLMSLAEEEEEAKYNEQAARLKQISLAEIGYAPAKIAQPQFVDIKVGAAALPLPSDDGLSAPVACSDGFKPGDVVVQEIPRPELFALPPPLPAPCGAPQNFMVAPPAGALSYLSSTSSASAANAYKQNVMMHKLGCF